MVYVLDVSGHQGEVDFAKVKASGIYGVMLKCSEGSSYLAPKFLPNYEKALAAGLKVGAYHFMRADTQADAVREGKWFAACVDGLKLELGAALDIEHEGVNWDGVNVTGEQAKNMVLGFWNGFANVQPEKNRWLYASKDYFLRFLNHQQLEQYPRWLANPSRLEFDLPVQMLQYSWDGRVDGVPNPVDLNVLWEDSKVRDKEDFLEHPLSFEERINLPEEAEKQLLYRIRGSIGEMAVDLEVVKE